MIKINDTTYVSGRHVGAILKQTDKNDIAHPKVVVVIEGGLALQSVFTFDETFQLVESDILEQVKKESLVMNIVTKSVINPGGENDSGNN